MRVNCKFYESRTYASGETVRMCRLDLAPEAPWRCPENCPSFERKLVDGGWVAGSLASTVNPAEEDPGPLDDHAVSMLDEAEDIINAMGPKIIAEETERRKQREAAQGKKRWWKFGRD